jgi:hypothetical protein
MSALCVCGARAREQWPVRTEDVSVEVLLQAFVGVVDAELREPVDVEALEAVDV